MGTREVSVTELKELDPKAFEKAYYKWCEHEPYHNWQGDLLQDWVAKLDKLGINTDRDRIEWSGFHSQGDGLCFTGEIAVEKFCEMHAMPDEYLPILEAERNYLLGRVRIIQSGRYYHSKTTYLDELGLDWFPSEDELTHGIFAGQRCDEFCEEVAQPVLEDFGEWVLGICRDYMDEMYIDLEEEYEYLTSEEQFIECCESNDVEFEIETDDEECCDESCD